jgi:hypothetical protein
MESKKTSSGSKCLASGPGREVKVAGVTLVEAQVVLLVNGVDERVEVQREDGEGRATKKCVRRESSSRELSVWGMVERCILEVVRVVSVGG